MQSETDKVAKAAEELQNVLSISLTSMHHSTHRTPLLLSPACLLRHP